MVKVKVTRPRSPSQKRPVLGSEPRWPSCCLVCPILRSRGIPTLLAHDLKGTLLFHFDLHEVFQIRSLVGTQSLEPSPLLTEPVGMWGARRRLNPIMLLAWAFWGCALCLLDKTQPASRALISLTRQNGANTSSGFSVITGLVLPKNQQQ